MRVFPKIKHYRDGTEQERTTWYVSIISLIVLQLIMLYTMIYYAA